MFAKEENPQSKKELVVSGVEALRVADALNATTMRMLQLLWKEPLDVSTIGKKSIFSITFQTKKGSLTSFLNRLRTNTANSISPLFTYASFARLFPEASASPGGAGEWSLCRP